MNLGKLWEMPGMTAIRKAGENAGKPFVFKLVPEAGLEPARPKPRDFKSSQSLVQSTAWLRGFPRTNRKQGVNVGTALVGPEGLRLSRFSPARSTTPCPTLRPMRAITDQWLGQVCPTKPDQINGDAGCERG